MATLARVNSRRHISLQIGTKPPQTIPFGTSILDTVFMEPGWMFHIVFQPCHCCHEAVAEQPD